VTSLVLRTTSNRASLVSPRKIGTGLRARNLVIGLSIAMVTRHRSHARHSPVSSALLRELCLQALLENPVDEDVRLLVVEAHQSHDLL